MSSFSKPRLAESPCPDPCPDAVALLERKLGDYLPADQVQRVRRAYEVGARAHEGQLRKSGEPYITHPVAVAGILAELRLDSETMIAAIRKKLGDGVPVLDHTH